MSELGTKTYANDGKAQLVSIKTVNKGARETQDDEGNDDLRNANSQNPSGGGDDLRTRF